MLCWENVCKAAARILLFGCSVKGGKKEEEKEKLDLKTPTKCKGVKQLDEYLSSCTWEEDGVLPASHVVRDAIKCIKNLCGLHGRGLCWTH